MIKHFYYAVTAQFAPFDYTVWLRHLITPFDFAIWLRRLTMPFNYPIADPYT